MSNALVEMEKASVHLGGRCVLDAVSFCFSKGDFMILHGSNGAGKTTLLKCILGLYRTSSGSVRRSFRPGQAGYVPQVCGGSVSMPLLVRDVVAIGRCAIGGSVRPQTRIGGEAVAQALETVGISALSGRPIRMLSGGEQQKMQLARILAQEPDALFLDEPTAHLDRGSRHDFMGLLERIYQKTGVGVLMVTHDDFSVPACCSRRMELRNRQLYECGDIR